MTTLKNPVRKKREFLNLGVQELAEQAGITLGTLRMVEGGAYLHLSQLLADRLASVFSDVAPEHLKKEYTAWRRRMEAERAQRAQKRTR